MSFEQIVLILFFIVLPLIQFLREAGQRSRERPAPTQRPAPDAPQRERPYVPKSAPPDVPKSAPPPVVVSPAPRLEEVAEVIDTGDRQIAVLAERLPTVRRGARLGRMAVGLRNPSELRRVIVLKTLIEPCRAMRPYEPPEGSRERDSR